MTYLLGGAVLKRMAMDQNAHAFYSSKFDESMFKGEIEQEAYKFTRDHFDAFHTLPTIQTLESKFPQLKEVEVPEPAKYYARQLELRFGYDAIDRATAEARKLLKENPESVPKAEAVLRDTLHRLLTQRYRQKILDVGKEAPELLVTTYHGMLNADYKPLYFGWPYLDLKGGVLPSEAAMIVGRPAAGKSFQMLYIAIHNWSQLQQNTLFVSMEMSALSCAQRVGSMYAHTNISQLKIGGYSTPTFKLFHQGLEKMQKEPAKFYIVDANLGGTVEEIFGLAEILGCQRVLIDGAYMIRHKNPKLGRYDRVAENAESIKRYTAEQMLCTVASWQFSRDAIKSKGPLKKKPGLEDIGYSDVIGQVGAIVLGLMQEEGVETIQKRRIEVLKGRDGWVGGFDVHWDFSTMNFRQFGIDETDQKMLAKDQLDFL